MAITINSTPNSDTYFPSMHDANWCVVTSDNVSQPSFKYIFDIYIGGNLIARLKSFPQVGNNKGIVNVSNVIRNYWSSYFKPVYGSYTTFAYQGNDNMVMYTIQYGEEYGGTLYTNLTMSEDLTAFNYAVDYMPFNYISWTGGFYFENVYPGTLLTNRETTKFTTRYSGSNLWVTGLNSSINLAENWSIDVRTFDGNTWSSFTNGGNYSVNGIVLMDISPQSLNNYLGLSKITSSTQTYEVRFKRGGSEFLTCSVDIICESRYQPMQLTFLNALGGYDTMNFSLVNKQSRTNEQKQYNSVEWNYNPTTEKMERFDEYGKFYGGSTTFFLNQTITYHLISDYVSLTDYYWLRELINSPEVYVHSGDNYLPVLINTNNWSEKKLYVDKLYNLELDITLGSKANSQFR